MPSLATNRKAHFNYEILDRIEAGIELLGFEVKAAKKGQISLDGSYVIFRGGEAWLTGAAITPLQPKNVPEGYEERRLRKLLMTKSQIADLQKKAEENGLTIVPLAMYNKGVRVKLEVAIARGKKKFDKRETLKKREGDRDIQRALKGE